MVLPLLPKPARKKSALTLYPVKVAALLIIPSLILYLFFSLWPLAYSVYIAFTDANATNIASEPKIKELEETRNSMRAYLQENKDFVLSQIIQLEKTINETISSLNDLDRYLKGVNSLNYSAAELNRYRNTVNGNLLKTLEIINSNETYLYFYTDLRESMSTAYTTANDMWSEMDTLLGFNLFPDDETLDAVRNVSLPRITQIKEELNRSIYLLREVDKDYDAYINIVLKDINNQIDRISLHFIGIQNIITLFSDARFPYSILKTVLFVLTSVPLKIGVGVGLAFLFSSPLIKSKKAMRAALLVPWALPVLLTVTTWRILFAPDEGVFTGIISGLIGYNFNIYTHEWDAFIAYNLVEAWLAYPFVMTVTMGAISGIPKELIEAAYIDGAGIFTRFRKITLPLTLKPILFAAILTTGASLQAFMVPLLLNSGGPASTISLPGFPSALGNTNELMVLYGYNRAWLDQQYGLSAATYLIVVGILLLYAVVWYYFIYKRSGGSYG